MSAASLPLKLAEPFQLPNLGVSQDAIGFATLTMESDKFICIRETAGGQAQVVILEVETGQTLRFPIQADAALMNPTDRILALRAGSQLQIFNIAEKKRLKTYTLPEQIAFWKWISNTTLGLVTGSAVYHWSIEGAGDPVKVFDRHASLATASIINYRVDSAQKWLCLVGMVPQDNRTLAGAIQLYSVDKKQTQPIEGHAAAFARYYPVAGGAATTLFAFASKSAGGSKLFVIEVSDAPSGFQKKIVDITYAPDAPLDFPVAMQINEKYELIFLITKMGYVNVYHLGTAVQLLQCRISSETIFVTAPHAASNGIIGVNRKGQVLIFSLDDTRLVQYLVSIGQGELARQLTIKSGLPGGDELFAAEFNRAFATGDFKRAAVIAAESPGGVLRTPATVAKFASLPAIPGQHPPLMQYFATLLEKGKLNRYESVEVSRSFVNMQRADVIEKWLQENKLECSEELGDLVRALDPKLALQIYFRGEVKHKVVQLLADTGAYDKIVAFCQRVQFQPDYMQLLQVIMLRNPAAAVPFAQLLLNDASGPLVNVNQCVDLLMSKNLVQETTSLLLDVLKYESGAPYNRPEDGPLQSKLLEINLISPNGVQVADMLLSKRVFTQFDKQRIAALCEKAGLSHRALELYTDIQDIRRVFNTANPALLSAEFLITYFSKLTAEDALACLRDLLRTNARANLQNVVQVAIQYNEQLTPKALIALFEQFNSFEGLYMFLAHVHKTSTDPEVHYKYIEAAVKMSQLAEVERVCKESKYYPAERVRDFLKEQRLNDMLPLIIVCDKHGFIPDLTTYLYKNNLSDYIKAYVQKINPANTPAVVGTLLDLDCPEEYVRNLVLSVPRGIPIEELTEQLEKRNRLRLVQGWLEARANEGSKEPALHNALAKIAIDLNREPEKFLTTNAFYDSLVVGKYCENRDPYLAFVAYKRGMNSDELIDVTNRHNLFKNQARYLVEKQDQALWAKVLAESPYRRSLIDQIVNVALPESNNSDEVSSTVKAFMAADLPKELIELLEKIVLETGTKFYGNRDLSNLLILTAIKADKQRVMEYVNRMESYDAVDIANIAIGAGLHKEAFSILRKHKMNVLAIQVLIEHIKSLPEAAEFAERVNEPDVWSKLARAQLDAGQVKEAIDSYCRANDPEARNDVIAAANKSSLFVELVKYLQMCRAKKLREPALDSELVYSLARIEKLAELEEFLSTPNVAQIQLVGDRCYDAGLYQAARLLYQNVSNHGRLASTLVKLGQFSQAVEVAKKANSIRSWKEVNSACLDAKDFRLASASGLHIIVHGDELDELIRNYESRGFKDEVISLLEQGLLLDRAHVGMFTELSILYSKYRPERLLEHLKAHFSRINIPRVMRVCERNQQWRELCFLHVHYDEHDHAALVQMQHPTEAWEHREFKEIMAKVANTDIIYRAVQFYLEQQPLLARDLLSTLQNKVDHTRVVQLVKKLNHLPLIKEYLVSVQGADVAAVNDALHSLYIDEANPEALRASLETHKNYDGVALAQQLEKHEFREFRRIASWLYKKNGRHAQAIDLSKQDKVWKDAMETAADSKDSAVVDSLLRYFVQQEMPECFAACLYTCYDYVRPDTALELAWRAKMTDFAMPYLVQVLREYTTKVDALTRARDEQEKAAQKEFGASAAPGSPVVAASGEMTVLPAVPMPMPMSPLQMQQMQQGVPPGAFVPLPGGVMPGVVPLTPPQTSYSAFALPQ